MLGQWRRWWIDIMPALSRYVVFVERWRLQCYFYSVILLNYIKQFLEVKKFLNMCKSDVRYNLIVKNRINFQSLEEMLNLNV